MSARPADAPSGTRIPADEIYDGICDRGNLTRRQLLIWAGDRLAPGLPVFVESGLFHIRGPLDPKLFQRAFRAVVEQCDAFQMAFREVDGWPEQYRDPHVASDIEVIDLPSTPARFLDALEEILRGRSEVELGGAGRLFDTVLIRRNAEHHVWLLAQHQLISDSWSFGLVYRYLVESYRRAQRGEGAAVCPPQFRDYLAYERAYRASPQHRSARAYWRERLSSLINLPAGSRVRVTRDATRIHRSTRRLGSSVTGAIRRLVATLGASVDMGLFVVFATLMASLVYRTTGTRAVILSVPFANRPSRRFKDTVGSFMNVCPVPVCIEPGDTFAAVLGRIERETWEAATHQGCVVHQPAGIQPYDVLVNVHKEAIADSTFAGLPMDAQWVAPRHRFNAMAAGVQDFGATGELTLAIDFNAAAFPSPARDEAFRALLRLLDACLADPQRAIDGVELVPNRVAGDPRKPPPAVPSSDGVPAVASPLSGVVHVLVEIWGEILGRNGIAPDEDFFALGGDSLLAYHMLVRVGATLFVEVSADDFFLDPTVSGLAAAVEAAHARGGAGSDIADAVREVSVLSDAEAALAVEPSDV